MRAARAPLGYRPFYVSHYGRHGSRYLLNEEEFAAVDLLSQKKDALTADGLALLADLEAIKQAHEGKLGILSEKGSSQHYGIGRRMAKSLRRLFRSRNRQIRCISTQMPRCIQSMANFALGLRDGGAKGSISLKTGYKYFEVLSARMDDSAWRSLAAAIRDSILAADVLPVAAQHFYQEGKSPETAELLRIVSSVDAMGAAARSLDEDLPDVLPRYLGEELLPAISRAESAYDYALFCETAEHGNPRIDKTARPLLRDILSKAEEALASGGIAADLRFGHDSGLLPLLKLIGIEGFAEDLRPAAAYDAGWHSETMIPMASNLQLRFFRNRRGEALVLFLYNERPVGIPSLHPVKGNYYRWSDVSAYFHSILD